MYRAFSFLLLTCCVAVVFASDEGTTGVSNKAVRTERFFDISELPEYEILYWPTHSSRGKSSKGNKKLTVTENNGVANSTTVKKKNKVQAVVGITTRPSVQGRITVKPNPEVVVVPVTLKPAQQPINNPSLEIVAVAETVKPISSTKQTTVSPKPKVTTVKNVVESSTKPFAISTKSPSTIKPQKPVQNVAISSKPIQSSTQKVKVTSKPITQMTIKPNNQKPNVPQKINQNSIRNTTAIGLQVTPVSVEPIKVTLKPVVTTVKPVKQKPPQTTGPCTCVLGVCTCCSGPLLDLLSQKACIKVIYIPEDFAFDYSLMLNNRVMYQNKISGKNPRPACIGIPRFNRIKLCARFSNIYFAGRNMHFCMGIEGRWDYDELFSLPFDCVRMGAQGFAIVKPEEGGGIPVPGGLDSIIDAGGDDIGEYDENVVRNLFYY